jgi:3-phosphoshikimate 1-carboxyvinyltransferase
MTALRFGPPGIFASEAHIPGDKSISHRAILLSACARGTTAIEGINRGGDALASMTALRALGISVVDDGSIVRVTGGEFIGDAGRIDCGNSGTTMRLLMGALAGRTTCTLDGDASLRRRPMERAAEPLRLMGATINTAAGGVPPVHMLLGGSLRGIEYFQPLASAQVKSAILLSGLRADGVTTVRSAQASRDHTERMLASMGARIQVERGTISIERGPLSAIERLVVPGDPSAAIFFFVAASSRRHTKMVIRDVCVNPTRTGAFDILRQMGARLHIGAHSERSGEPVAAITVEGGGALRAVQIEPEAIPSLIDEIPALCALAALAEGELVVRGAAELRVKESDRIASTAQMVRAFGGEALETDDGIIVRGGAKLHAPAAIDTGGDHRIGMSAAALAAAIGEPLEIRDASCIGTSFPDFAARWSEAFGMTVSST